MKPFIEVMIGIKRVLNSDSIQVNNLGHLSSQHLQLYFEHPRLVGDIDVVDMRAEDEFVILKFADRSGLIYILQIMNQSHSNIPLIYY